MTRNPFESTLSVLVCLGLLTTGCLPLAAADTIPLSRYLDYARSAADWTWENQDSLIEKWRAGFDPVRRSAGSRRPA